MSTDLTGQRVLSRGPGGRRYSTWERNEPRFSLPVPLPPTGVGISGCAHTDYSMGVNGLPKLSYFNA